MNPTCIIGQYAFKHCTSLMLVELPKKINYIFEGVFQDCKSLINLTIPDTCTEINLASFLNCTNLKKIKYKNHYYSYDDLLEYKKFD